MGQTIYEANGAGIASESPADHSDQKRPLSGSLDSPTIIAAKPGLFRLIHRPTGSPSHADPVGNRPTNPCAISQIPIYAARDKLQVAD
jgi:hypothetical protein